MLLCLGINVVDVVDLLPDRLALLAGSDLVDDLQVNGCSETDRTRFAGGQFTLGAVPPYREQQKADRQHSRQEQQYELRPGRFRGAGHRP